ncbi:hypothetical protein PU560_15240, partial [Georgenia sp. 10Sc9-8]|nr:hypothetical protein [Georgenia halotolerans]
ANKKNNDEEETTVEPVTPTTPPATTPPATAAPAAPPVAGTGAREAEGAESTAALDADTGRLTGIDDPSTSNRKTDVNRAEDPGRG